MVMRTVDRLVPWIVGALVATVGIGAVYGAVQQGDRSSADDAPQALISQLVSVSGSDTPGAAQSPRVNIAESRMPFYVVYNAYRHLLITMRIALRRMHFGELVHTEHLDDALDPSHLALLDELIARAAAG